MDELNPCETCNKSCGYRLFIDCPIWNEWAERINQYETEVTNNE